ncbi:MAG: radical SAM protein [Oscillospiraceae bacterium]|nr:radical SAM protein [Oscillospiraceae bacterium]
MNCIGAFRVAAIIKKIETNTDAYFILPHNERTLATYLNPNRANVTSHYTDDAEIISKLLAGYDIVCFSSMSNTFNYAAEISKKLKERCGTVFTLLGGVHARLYPNEAIGHFDAICTGEGEKPARQFIQAFREGRDFYRTKGLWFRKGGGEIVKNPSETLNSNRELNEFQSGYNLFDCLLYDNRKKKFVQFKRKDYLRLNGLQYNTMWTLGCPFACTYCSNSGFAEADKGNRMLRYPEPEAVIREIEQELAYHPYVRNVSFHDDNLTALPYDVLKGFCELYKERIHLPFAVYGIHPKTIDKEKMDLLASHGMFRSKLGIESGCEKTLRQYGRNMSIQTIRDAASISTAIQRKYRRHMIPPDFDVITDNPTETREDIITSLRLYNSFERPFTLNVFSLRKFPGTKLTAYFDENGIDCPDLPFFAVRPTMCNVLIYLIACVKIPDRLFERLLLNVKGNGEEQKEYNFLLRIAHFLFLVKRGLDCLLKLDFSRFSGRWLYVYWTIFYRWRR